MSEMLWAGWIVMCLAKDTFHRVLGLSVTLIAAILMLLEMFTS